MEKGAESSGYTGKERRSTSMANRARRRAEHLFPILVASFLGLLLFVTTLGVWRWATRPEPASIVYLNQPFPVDKASYESGKPVRYFVLRRIEHLASEADSYLVSPELVQGAILLDGSLEDPDGCHARFNLPPFTSVARPGLARLFNTVSIPANIPPGTYHIEGVSRWMESNYREYPVAATGMYWRSKSFEVTTAAGDEPTVQDPCGEL